MFGSDFFKIFHFFFEILRLIAEIFGNDEDKKGFDNHLKADRKITAKAANVTSETRKADT